MTSQHTSADFDAAHAYDGVGFTQMLGSHATVLDALDRRAASQPNEPYLTAIARDGTATTITFGELADRTAAFAEFVRADLGVSPGDVVALIPANDVPSAVAMLGTLRAGCPCLVLSPADPVVRLRQLAESQGAKIVLRGGGDVDGGALETVPVPALSALERGQSRPPLPAVDPLADALLFGTSGSTAASKVVAQSHRNAATNAEAVHRHHGTGPGQRILSLLPIYHANAVHLALLSPLVSGGHAVLPHAFEPLSGPRLIERFRPRIASVVPSILEAILETWREPAVPDEFEYFISAAAALRRTAAAGVLNQFGRRVLQGYGLTETTNFSTTLPRGLSDECYRRLIVDADIPSVGVAVYGNEVTVRRRDGSLAAPGEVGEICMRGHSVMSRYVGNDEATAEAFRGGWFHSQDMGYAVADEGHTFVVLTGRTKNIAKVRGETVSLDEMERLLLSVPGVADAVCLTTPDRFTGEQVTAVVVFTDGVLDVRPSLASVLAPAAMPTEVVAVEAIPRTTTGKIRRREYAETLGLVSAVVD